MPSDLKNASWRSVSVAFAIITVLTALWLGTIPSRYLPWSTIKLEDSSTWFLDLKLASLKTDRDQCRLILKPPVIRAQPIADQIQDNGCGWRNGVQVVEAGRARISASAMTCQMATALALWIEHDVQTAAAEHLGAQVTRLENMGVYACRNIRGRASLVGFRSQHAYANAIDISAFRLTDGRRISVKAGWAQSDAAGRFLKSIHRAACRRFRVALSPDYNAAHHDHFHLDRGAFKRCR